jgi:DNA-binding NtrC family response regulator
MKNSQPKQTVLIVDDEPSICEAFERFFSSRGWSVTSAPTGHAGLKAYKNNGPFDIVFLDIRLPDGSGLDFLELFLAIDPKARLIIITAFGGLDIAVQAIQSSAFDYLPKPIDLDRALELAQRAIQSPRETWAETPDAFSADSPSPIKGSSAAMQAVYTRIARIADSSATVLILGETGTGKEMAARAIHMHSDRRNEPFIAVNCGAIPESMVESELFGYVRGAFTGADTDRPGRFEQADQGTLFLDEVGELPPAAQVKLLRVLDSQVVERLGSVNSRPINVRILAATNRDLFEEVVQKRFRKDLYYRLAGLTIRLPNLRDRGNDLIELSNHFLEKISRERKITFQLVEETVELIRSYDWPGNVRELKNAINHACTLSPSGLIMPGDMPIALRETAGASNISTVAMTTQKYLETIDPSPGSVLRDAIRPIEERLIREAIDHHNGHLAQAATWLGIHRNTLRTKMRELDL